MRQIKISVFAMLIVLPAFADARLPVVNIASGGVSARAAFGEPVVEMQTKNQHINNEEYYDNAVAEINMQGKKRSVVPRSTYNKNYVLKNDVLKDVGGQIVADADILIPQRPSSDLWVSNEAPLRLPRPEEFSVVKSDFELPEEYIDMSDKQNINFAKSFVEPEIVKSDYKTSNKKSLDEFDMQIAKLNDLQRRADESVQEKVEKNQNNFIEPSNFASTEKINWDMNKKTSFDSEEKDNEIKLTRLVVPADEDVVVRAVQKVESPRIASVRDDMTKMTPTELRKAFRKTFLSENKHLSTFQIDDRFDVASDMSSSIEGFTTERDLSEAGGIRPLEIKIKFRNEDSSLSRENYNLLTKYASIVLSNPTRAIQVSIPESATRESDARKLAARRLAIVEQVLRDTGVSEQRILPVLSQRDEDGFVLRMISLDQYETLTKKQRDMFGDTVNKKTYKSMSW